jgi:twitching motility protein PilT
MALSPDDALFGRIALHYKLISTDQLSQGHELQALSGGRRSLQEILVEMGFLTPHQIQQLLQAQREYLTRKAQAPAPEAARPAATPGLPQGSTLGPLTVQESLPAGLVQAAAQSIPFTPASAPPATGISRAAGAIPAGAPWAAATGTPFPGGTDIEAVLTEAIARGASDVHLHSGAPLTLRLHGSLVAVGSEPLAPIVVDAMLERVLEPEHRRALEEHGQVDIAFVLPGRGRFRVNAYRQQRGIDAVLRAIPPEPPTLAQLGMPETLARFTQYHQGMVLLTGPAGCGKSSTLAALLNIVNASRQDHIITIEDPIEYVHPSKSCVVNQRQVGRHTGSFARALRAALREDPDVIAIGELRDLETISLALTAAETGHLVLATLHTSSAIRTINRILGVFPPSQQDQIRTMVSESLRAVVSQRLVSRADGTGRVPALEILLNTKAAANLVRDNKTFQLRSVLQTGSSHGMCLLDASLADLVKRRVVTREEAMKHAEEPAKLPAA